MRIGGIDQWVSVTGEDRSNPIILVVHGGPGEAQWPQAAKYKPWEKAFTVAQWDQRGTGHTYGRYKEQTPDVNLEQIVSDGIKVAEYLRRTYGKEKIVVLGHSWGSIYALSSTSSAAGQRWLMRWANGHRTHQLHLVVHCGFERRRRLAFRGALRANPELV